MATRDAREDENRRDHCSNNRCNRWQFQYLAGRRMARRKEVVGTCCLCLETTVLTFEHVPPEGAFNDSPVILADINRLIGKDLYAELLKARGRDNQRGAG